MGPNGPDDRPLYTIYNIETPLILQPDFPVLANFGFGVGLIGYQFGEAEAVSGGTIPLLLFWQVDGVPPATWRPFVHLEDRWGHRWGQVEPEAYASRDWAVGDKVVQYIEVPVGAGAPAESYQLNVGFFDVASGQAVARFDLNGRYAGSSFPDSRGGCGGGRGSEPPTDTAPNVLDIDVIDGVRIVGSEMGRHPVGNGEPFEVALWWLAEDERPLPPLRVRYELYDGRNVGKILQTAAPVRGSYPSDSWEAPQFVIDRQTLEIPLQVTSGEYRVQARILNEIDDTLAEIDLGPLTVVTSERLFELPSFDEAAEASFGGEIALRGYDWVVDVAEGEGTLTLGWQALTRPVTDYTVFVHILNQDGSCCVWQQDSVPQGGEKRTSLWLDGEVVMDSYRFTLPEGLESGNYEIEVGFYIAASGQRLGVETEMDHTADVVYLRPLVVD